MKLEILGSVSPYCKDDCNCPSFLIWEGKDIVLLDLGNGTTRLMPMESLLYNLNVFISHLHADHCGDLIPLGYASYCYHNMGKIDNKIDIYLPYDSEYNNNKYNDPWEICNPKYKNSEYNCYKLIKNLKEQYWNVHNIEKSSYSIGPMNVKLMRTNHSNISYAIKVKHGDSTIVYTGDIGYGDAGRLIEFSKNSDILICESSLIRSHNIFSDKHLHAYQAAEIAKYAKVKKLLLTHFWPETPKEEYLEEAKMFFENTEVAIEEKQYVLGGK